MTASIALTKKSIAHRLIISSIEMFNDGRDPIAVHAVAASAFAIVRDLMKKSGKSYVAAILAMVFFYLASAPSLEKSLDWSDEFHQQILKIKKAIDSGKLKSPSQINIQNLKEFEYEALEYVVKPYNFTKHADKDHEATILEEAFCPVDVIMNALAGYSQLFPDDDLDGVVQAFINKLPKR